MTRSYEGVLDALGGLISGRQRSIGTNLSEAYGLMGRYLKRIHITQEQLDTLKIIHIAGTKGKGSTAAFTERVLREAGYKTGLFTSPHLLDVRERIRINGDPVDVETFVEQFWSCFDKLKSPSDFTDDDGGMPAYFRFLTLLGLQIFLVQKVDVVILEVGLGGRLDATNVVNHPAVCGISSLGLDHMDVLGDTIAKIAREKAGILKKGIPAFTVQQLLEAQDVLEEVAGSVGAPLMTVEPLSSYKCARPLRLGLAGRHQEVNASLALALARCWEKGQAAPAARARMKLLEQHMIPDEYAKGFEQTFWPGRGQVVEDEANGPDELSGRLTFFLDGAHTAESMATCAEWYSEASTRASAGDDDESVYRILLFNCMQERDPEKLLLPLTRTMALNGTRMDHALFVPPVSSYASLKKAGPGKDLAWQQALQAVWDRQCAGASFITSKPHLVNVSWSPARASVLPNLQVTLDWFRQCVRAVPGIRMQVLVTGSLYMVGDMLRLLGHTRVK